MNFFRIFRIFLWKNALYLRNKMFELITIFSLCMLIFILYLYSSFKVITTPTFSPEVKDSRTLIEFFPGNEGDYLMYSPSSNPRIDDLMESVRIEFEKSHETVKAYNSTAEMTLQLEQNCLGNCFAVSFDPLPEHGNLERNMLRYKISSNAMRVSSKKRYVNDEEITMAKENDDYIRTGFLSLQHIIDKCFIKSVANQANYEMMIGSMPATTLKVIDSQRVIMFGSLYSILLNVLLLGTFLVPLVEEKQNGLKEFLCVATPLNFLNGVTFFIIRFLLYMIFSIFVLISAAFFPALGTIPFIYMCILMILFKLSVMSYTYLLSVCFHSVFYAKVGGLLMLIVPYIFRFEKSAISSMASIFFSTKTFMDGIEVFQVFTNKHRNFLISDLTTNITDWSYSIISIYLLLIFQCGFYSLLYNYLSCIFPGPGGLKKPYLFFLKPSYYKKRQRNEYTTAERGSDAIIIQDLVKTFKVPKRTIHIADRLNMVIKNKQITVLLGHNGAGKTTTMNMIMGSVPKDSGKIIVCSERDVASYRHLIGFCPQHSVFMEYMTCRQHLRFFAELRGMDIKTANSLTDKLLCQLKLQDKENEYGRQLSGGMKRRLSLGIALAGETKVVILDEPSSGLDIESRRELWDILLELRKTKAVLVTTHHMEEAEVLGDTICILSNGRLQRTGSPLELKRKVGCGYILKICTKRYGFKEVETLNLIQRHIPEANILNFVPPTLHVSLPYESKNNYKEMLTDLEHSLMELGIESISITDTSLEDVFLNCSADVDQIDGSVQPHTTEPTRIPYEPLTPPTNISFCQQFCAIFYKKFIFLKSEWKFALLMFSLPFLSALLAIVLMHSSATTQIEDALPLNLNIVKDGRIYLRASGEQTELGRKVESFLKQNIEKYGIKVKNLEEHFGVSVAEEMLEMQEVNLADFLQNVIGVIDLKKDAESDELKVFVYFSANIYHSSVVLTNLIDNAVLKAVSSEQSNIETQYVPVRRFVTDVSPSRLEYYAVIVPIGIFFYMFFYISLPFRERESGFKNLQAVPVLRYWLSTFSFDFLQHSIVCIMLGLLQIAVMPDALYNNDEILTITCSIFLYGISYLPIIYIFANSFRSISAISTYLLSMLIVSAIIPLITSGSVQAMIYYETTIMLMRILPDFNLNHQLRIINENFVLGRNNVLSSRQKSNNSATRQLQELLNTGTICWYALFVFFITAAIFIYIIENKKKCQEIKNFFTCNKCRGIGPDAHFTQEEESLVHAERAKIEGIPKKDESIYPLLVRNLSKSYGRKTVVCNLNFVVEKEACFGLLGVNGAGKTTTFQMITANATSTKGSVQIDGIDLNENEIQYRYRFGYCPQYDCLNDFMTAFESLKYMAKLRNVSYNKLDDEIQFWLDKLDLIKYTHVQIRHYSGGTKRKLNAAMAMIGSPSLVLLDEPTTGVDPVSRRFLWKCVQEFQKRGKTIVLTSHSMDECEQLCNRLAIMAEGRFKCIGSVPELKRKFGSGFTIKMKMSESALESPSSVSEITKHLRKEFPDCHLREDHAGMLTYYIKHENHIKWSAVFESTENFMLKSKHLIDDYSVNESTLEDIFLKFDPKYRNNSDNLPTPEREEV